MTAITSNADGNWTTGGTWIGGVAPGIGDTATINHNVTVNTTITVGTSPVAGTAVVTLNTATKTLTIASGGTLNCRGDLALVGNGDTTYVGLDVQGGGALYMDATVSSVKYFIRGRNSTNDAAVTIKGSGTSTSNTALISSLGSVNGAITNVVAATSWSRTLNFNFNFTRFYKLGDTSNNALNLGSSNWWESASSNTGIISITNCVFDTCGTVNLGSLGTAAGFSTPILMQNNCWKASVDTGSNHYSLNLGGQSTSNITIDGNYLDLGLFIGGSQAGTVVNNNVMAGGISNVQHAGKFPTYQQNVINCAPSSVALGSGVVGDSTNNYWLFLDAFHSNPHGPGGLHDDGYTITFTNDVFECAVPDAAGHTYGATDGDFIFPTAGVGGGTFSFTVTGCILLPTMDGYSPGELISCISGTNGVDPNYRITANHNTVVSCTVANPFGNTGAVGVGDYGETFNGFGGMYAAIKSNLVWSQFANSAVIFDKQPNATTLVTDVCLAANIDYNATWNGETTNMVANGSGTPAVGLYNFNSTANIFSTGQGQIHSVTVSSNPFLDFTRNSATWSASLGGTATPAGAAALMQQRLDWSTGGGLSGATPLAMWTWVRNGFQVTNAVLNAAGHDGATIGAMPFLLLNGPPLYYQRKQLFFI